MIIVTETGERVSCVLTCHHSLSGMTNGNVCFSKANGEGGVQDVEDWFTLNPSLLLVTDSILDICICALADNTEKETLSPSFARRHAFIPLIHDKNLDLLGEGVKCLHHPMADPVLQKGNGNVVLDSYPVFFLHTISSSEHGSSGCPIMNSEGNVVGVTIAGNILSLKGEEERMLYQASHIASFVDILKRRGMRSL